MVWDLAISKQHENFEEQKAFVDRVQSVLKDDIKGTGAALSKLSLKLHSAAQSPIVSDFDFFELLGNDNLAERLRIIEELCSVLTPRPPFRALLVDIVDNTIRLTVNTKFS